MSTPRRFKDGLSYLDSDDVLGAFPYPDPTRYKIMDEHFNLLPDGDEAWTHTNTNGTLTVAADGAVQTLAGADNDLSQLSTASVIFALVAGKKFFFEAKCKVDKGAGGTIGQQEMFVGLASYQQGANFVASDGLSWAADDMLGFGSFDGSTAVDAVNIDTDVVSTVSAIDTLVDATFVDYGIYFDGTTVKFYINNSQVASSTVYSVVAMTPTLYIKAGEGKPSVLTTKRLFVASEY